VSLLGGFAISATGGTSAAGLRQALASDALPVIFDEAEGDSAKSAGNIDDVLALMRHASANLDARVIKGGADGRSSSSIVRSCFCLSAIRDPIRQAADQSRVTVLSLHSATASSKVTYDTKTSRLADQVCRREWSERFRGRIFARLSNLLEAVRIFTQVSGSVFEDSRMGDQIGALMGGAWVAARDVLPTPSEARERLMGLSWDDQRDIISEASDEHACLRAILESHIRIDGLSWHGEVSIGELIRYMQTTNPMDAPGGITTTEAVQSLARYGLKYRPVANRLWISNSNTMLQSKIMARTQWPVGWGKLLARLPGAIKPDKTVRIGGYVSRVVSVQLDEGNETDDVVS
jgi:putative DNA primase/helicase